MPKIFGASWGVVLLATLIFFIFGFIWYAVFETQWLIAAGMTAEQAQAAMKENFPIAFPIVAFVLTLGQAIGILMVLNYAAAKHIKTCVKIAFWLAVCFAAPILAYACVYGGYSLTGYLVDLGHLLIGWILVAATYGFFRSRETD